jgi:hypothetical protein
MTSKRSFIDAIVLLGQTAGVAVAPLALTLLPPARGAILLVPVGATNAIGFARSHAATLIRPGPLAGSIVVFGDRAALAGDPLQVLALSASAVGCGDLATQA